MQDEVFIELLFEDFSEAELKELMQTAKSQRFSSGDFLFREGDESDAIYIIFSGRVEISTKRDNLDKISFPAVINGTVLGEIAFFDHKPRTASVRAIDNIDAIVINKPCFYDIENNHPKLAIKLLKEIIRITAERLRWADQKVKELTV